MLLSFTLYEDRVQEKKGSIMIKSPVLPEVFWIFGLYGIKNANSFKIWKNRVES
jgi:hypothetical protein